MEWRDGLFPSKAIMVAIKQSISKGFGIRSSGRARGYTVGRSIPQADVIVSAATNSSWKKRRKRELSNVAYRRASQSPHPSEEGHSGRWNVEASFLCRNGKGMLRIRRWFCSLHSCQYAGCGRILMDDPRLTFHGSGPWR